MSRHFPARLQHVLLFFPEAKKLKKIIVSLAALKMHSFLIGLYFLGGFYLSCLSARVGSTKVRCLGWVF
jgi:hypothetical protein